MPPPLTLTLLLIPPTLYALHLSHRLAPTSHLPITSSATTAFSLTTSPTIATLVNPARHAITTDSRSVCLSSSHLPLSPSGYHSLSDREILTKFVRGVFGGWVFAPERWALGWARWWGMPDILDIRALGEGEAGKGKGKGVELWGQGEVRAVEEWRVGMRVVGTFEVVHVKVAEEVGVGGEDGMERESYVDFVFGSDTGFLRGMHRFSVLWRWEAADGVTDGEGGGQETCELRFSCLTCDPMREQPSMSKWLQRFHLVYAMLLFREGVAEVLAPKG